MSTFVVLAHYSGVGSGTAIMLVTSDIHKAIAAAKSAETKHGYSFYNTGSGVCIHRVKEDQIYPADDMDPNKVFERWQMMGRWEEKWYDAALQKKFEDKPEPAAAK